MNKEHSGACNKVFITEQIRSSNLHLYEEAARRTGFEISVIAHEGESYISQVPPAFNNLLNNKVIYRTVIIGKGNLGISITRPESQKNYSLFWDAYTALRTHKA